MYSRQNYYYLVWILMGVLIISSSCANDDDPLPGEEVVYVEDLFRKENQNLREITVSAVGSWTNGSLPTQSVEQAQIGFSEVMDDFWNEIEVKFQQNAGKKLIFKIESANVDLMSNNDFAERLRSSLSSIGRNAVRDNTALRTTLQNIREQNLETQNRMVQTSVLDAIANSSGD
jgi:hypothetical protein